MASLDARAGRGSGSSCSRGLGGKLGHATAVTTARGAPPLRPLPPLPRSSEHHEAHTPKASASALPGVFWTPVHDPTFSSIFACLCPPLREAFRAKTFLRRTPSVWTLLSRTRFPLRFCVSRFVCVCFSAAARGMVGLDGGRGQSCRFSSALYEERVVECSRRRRVPWVHFLFLCCSCFDILSFLRFCVSLVG